MDEIFIGSIDQRDLLAGLLTNGGCNKLSKNLITELITHIQLSVLPYF